MFIGGAGDRRVSLMGSIIDEFSRSMPRDGKLQKVSERLHRY